MTGRETPKRSASSLSAGSRPPSANSPRSIRVATRCASWSARRVAGTTAPQSACSDRGISSFQPTCLTSFDAIDCPDETALSRHLPMIATNRLRQAQHTPAKIRLTSLPNSVPFNQSGRERFRWKGFPGRPRHARSKQQEHAGAPRPRDARWRVGATRVDGRRSPSMDADRQIAGAAGPEQHRAASATLPGADDLLVVENVSKRFGGTQALDQVGLRAQCRRDRRAPRRERRRQVDADQDPRRRLLARPGQRQLPRPRRERHRFAACRSPSSTRISA